MASFSDSFMDLLEADLESALSLSTDQVYRGRSPREGTRTGNALEVWIEPLDRRSDLGGLAGLVSHNYRVHLRLRGPRETTKTGQVQGDLLDDYEQTVRRRYDGLRNFYASLTDLVGMRVGDSNVGDDNGPELVDRYMTLTAVERS